VPPDTYDELIRSSVVSADPASQSDLVSQRPRHQLILRLLDRHAQRRDVIVDVGPGNGALLRLARGELGFQRLVAVDIRRRDPSFLTGLDNVQQLDANFNDPGFLHNIPDETADAVVATEVLEHILNHPAGFMEECWRVVRPGGLLAVTTPNPCTAANAARLLAGRGFLWGDDWFAETRKLENGRLTGYPFVHFREYPPDVFLALIGGLPGARVAASGFVANAGVPWESTVKTALLAAVHRARLGGWRPVSHSQYAVAVKTG
jgi:SAM-dependent methyltransferase